MQEKNSKNHTLRMRVWN